MGKSLTDFDIVVTGGGLAGLATAVAVARRGFSCALLAPPAPMDRRTSALMRPSVDILLENGLIDDPDALGSKLSQIRIIDATNRLLRAPEALFDSVEAGFDGFGWNFSNSELLKTMRLVAEGLENLRFLPSSLQSFSHDENSFTLLTDNGEELSCKLLVGADGKGSTVRAGAGIGVKSHKFEQSALVCDLMLERPLNQTSVEFHYPNGPFTLVPAGKLRTNLVWIENGATLAALRASGDDMVLAKLQAQSQNLFGTLKLASPTFVFELSTLQADIAGRNGVVLVGEAAHAFPPIGAQGLNLGLRDIDDLLTCLSAIKATQPGWAILASADYAKRRAGDLQRTAGMVDGLFRSLISEALPVQALRAGGLWALKGMPTLRRRAFSQGMGVRG